MKLVREKKIKSSRSVKFNFSFSKKKRIIYEEKTKQKKECKSLREMQTMI